MNCRRTNIYSCCLAGCCAVALVLCLGGTVGARTIDLTQLTIDELLNIEVVSAARKEQSVLESAAAISVLTAEDLRRSGATSIPEALRLLPGVQAGRVNGSKWAISARGFNDLFANKLLVLVDGRTVYTPVFSGVFWESQDVVLADVERIEVIRGPGGTLWGANAVNGVINVLTKDARYTRGGLVELSGGTQERGAATVRFGGRLAEGAHYRVYAKHFDRCETESVDGDGLGDDWHVSRVGARAEWARSDVDLLTLQGELYQGELGEPLKIITSLTEPFVETFVDAVDLGGGHLLGRWKRRLGAAGELGLQVYYDRSNRQGRAIEGLTQTLDAELQHRFSAGARHAVVWGAGGRLIADDFASNITLSFAPPERRTHLLSAFLQDDIALHDERVRLTVGGKLEHNSYTGVEVQPNVRILWRLAESQALWGAVSRAVHTPSRADRDEFAVVAAMAEGELAEGAPLALLGVVGSDDFVSEELLAFDAGYRASLGEGLSLDLAAFYNTYDNLRTNELRQPFFRTDPEPRHLFVPLVVDNNLHGTTHGLEVAASWQAMARWRLQMAYTYLHMDMELDAGSTDLVATTWDEENPSHQVTLRSGWEPRADLSLDATLRYVDELPILEADRYLTLDARLGWSPVDRAELFLVGRHLLDSPHLEFPRQMVIVLPGTVAGEVRAGLSYRF